MLYLTDYNHAELMPLMSDAMLASIAESMPTREFMIKEMQKRKHERPYLSDLFYVYLTRVQS
jgi:hypothetical protein